MIPQPKFNIGDVVFYVTTYQGQGTHPCPDCHGTQQWTATSPAGETFAVNCLRCARGYALLPRDIAPLTYKTADYSVRQLTVGSVRVDTGANHPISYMCDETGIGSGSLYNEDDFFTDEEAAKVEARARADAWQAKLDVGPINPIRAESATWPLEVAMARTWDHEMYDAWFEARRLMKALGEIVTNEGGEYEVSESLQQTLEELIVPQTWHDLHPFDTLLTTCRELTFNDRLSPTMQDTLTKAIDACTAPEKREK